MLERNGVIISDAETVTCRECGANDLKSIEKSHLSGSRCTKRLPNRDAYQNKYPDAPVVTREAYEGMTRTSIDP